MKYISYLLMFVLSISMYSCYDDSENEEALANQINQTLETMVRETLNGEYVAYTKVTVNSVDKTLLDGGCPTRLVFSWKGDSMCVTIPEMKIGNMPFAISFECNCAVTLLNSWEEDEHAGGNEAWFKFVGTNGSVSTGNGLKPNGSSIKGYFHPGENVIEFVIDYNVMNVRTVCERQALDVNRVRVYDDEMKKYMEDLNVYKKENGLLVVPGYNTIISGPTGSGLNDSLPREDFGSMDIIEVDKFISLTAVKGILSGDIVIKSDVTVGGNVMAQSLPTIINFSWAGDVMTIKISDLQIGRMPFSISFSCDCYNVDLTEDDLSTYSSMWYKFEGRSGMVSSDPSVVSGNEGVVICYFDPVSMQIAMNVNFNVELEPIADFPKQVISFE